MNQKVEKMSEDFSLILFAKYFHGSVYLTKTVIKKTKTSWLA
jgi:hypothetical protein